MSGYTDCYVAFLDILGFKNIINTKSYDEVKEVFQSIITSLDAGIALTRACEESDTEYVHYNESLHNTKIRVMSDSIIVATPSTYPEALAAVIDICRMMQVILYDECSIPIFLRGAIAKGDLYIDDNLLFGKGMIDAYLAQEHYAIYPRVIIPGNILKAAKGSVEEGFKGFVQDEDGYYYIDSLDEYMDCDDQSIECEFSRRYDRLMNVINEQLDGYTDARVRQKYQWLQGELHKVSMRRLGLITEKRS